MLPQGVLASLPRLALPAAFRPGPALDFIANLPPQLAPYPARRLANRGLGPVLGQAGTLEVRLATSAREVRAAQRLRYEVFYEEMSAVASPACRLLRRDIDAFDAVCDHLIVLDRARMVHKPGRPARPLVVGAYRLLRQDQAQARGFYSQGEFDVAALLRRHPGRRFLELGRSCVLPAYRTKRTVELLWHGIWAYVRHHRIDAMFGCASLDGIDPDQWQPQLALLGGHRANGEWAASAHPHRHVPMTAASLDKDAAKSALRALPPLLKGYLRLGAALGDGAVIDPQFQTLDVLVILPVERIEARYIAYYGASGERYGG